MKKTWSVAEITELNIEATAQIPTEKMEADDFQNGYFKQGTSNGSGPKETIPYYPS